MEEQQRRHIRGLWEKLNEIQSPENLTLPVYVHIDTSSEELGEEPRAVKKWKSLKYVDDRAEEVETEEESSSIGTDNEAIDHASISLSSSSCDA